MAQAPPSGWGQREEGGRHFAATGSFAMTAPLAAFAADRRGLMKTERMLLAGAIAFAIVAVLLLLGVDILGWFGIEAPVEEGA